MRLHGSRGRPLDAPAAFIHPCQPIVVRLYTMRGAALDVG
jgi:hypothetical protein